MNKKIKNNSGITLIALVVTIIIMIIIASIAVYAGTELIKKSKIQTLETNMFTIQAKAKAYAEEIDSKVWALAEDKESKRQELFVEKGLEKSSDTEYTVTDTGLEKMGLKELKGQTYIVIFEDNEYKKIDVKYTKGIEYDGKTITLLSEIEKALSLEEE